MNNLTIKKLESIGEVKELIKVFSLAFESDYTTTDAYLEAMLNSRTSVILGAVLDRQVVGGIVAFEMTPIHGTKELYIYDIAVHPQFQKQSIGTLLIKEIKEEARARGAGLCLLKLNQRTRMRWLSIDRLAVRKLQ